MAGRTFSFEVTALSGADAATLFDLAADGGRWSRWAGPYGLASSWERQGDPPPGGIGAIRRLGRWPIVVREETIAYERDRLHGYTMLTRAPLRDYRAEVALDPRDDGTHVAWRGTFTELIPGTGPLVEWVLKRLLGSLTRRLVRAAES
jgi:Polyketide cyclase / dehydrase and lipid transport